MAAAFGRLGRAFSRLGAVVKKVTSAPPVTGNGADSFLKFDQGGVTGLHLGLL